MVKDVYPQFLNAKVTETGVNTFSKTEVPLPTIQSLSNGRAQVVELLKIIFEIDQPDTVAGAVTQTWFEISKKDATGWLNLNDSNVIVSFKSKTRDITSVGFSEIPVLTQVMDLMDGSGKGYLIGTQKLFLFIQSFNNTSAKTAYIKFMYRIREVSASELIGIIQE